MPSLRNLSYQFSRRPPSVKRIREKVEPFNTNFLWNYESILSSPINKNIKKYQKTRIATVEHMFGKHYKRKKIINTSSNKNEETFQTIVKKLKKEVKEKFASLLIFKN